MRPGWKGFWRCGSGPLRIDAAPSEGRFEESLQGCKRASVMSRLHYSGTGCLRAEVGGPAQRRPPLEDESLRARSGYAWRTGWLRSGQKAVVQIFSLRAHSAHRLSPISVRRTADSMRTSLPPV